MNIPSHGPGLVWLTLLDGSLPGPHGKFASIGEDEQRSDRFALCKVLDRFQTGLGD